MMTSSLIREAYESIKRSRTKKKFYRSSDKFLKQFDKAAAICERLGADPRVYVEAHFHNVDPETIYPTHLASAYSETKVRRYIEENRVDPERELDFYVRHLQSFISAGWSVEEALNSDLLKFPAWFRVCITKEANQAIINRYAEEARDELYHNPELKTYLEEEAKLDINRLYV